MITYMCEKQFEKNFPCIGSKPIFNFRPTISIIIYFNNKNILYSIYIADCNAEKPNINVLLAN